MLAETSLPNHLKDNVDMELDALLQLEPFSWKEDNPTVQESPTSASKHYDRLKLEKVTIYCYTFKTILKAATSLD